MLLGGINHVAILTKDADGLHAFYREVFDATVFNDQRTGDLRLSLVNVGPTAQLNVFEIAGNAEADRQTPMFARGRIDHIGLEAASQEAFDEVLFAPAYRLAPARRCDLAIAPDSSLVRRRMDSLRTSAMR